MRVLIADDDELSRRKLGLVLGQGGYTLEFAADGIKAYEYLTSSPAPALAILDVMMPGMSGIEICRRIRQRGGGNQPYIILLTMRTSKRDVVEGLDAGANDYVVKPFNAEELRARVRVGVQVLNVQEKLRDRAGEPRLVRPPTRPFRGLLRKDTRGYEFGPFRLEAAERRLTRDGVAVPLTAKVFDLLLLLVQNAGHLVEKEEIMREVWPNSMVEDNNLTVSMSVLRKTLHEGTAGGYIETVPKLGYRFVMQVTRID